MPMLLIDKELIELVNGEFVKPDIKLPDNLTYTFLSLDNNIVAICEAGDFILIYELEGRRFELKHNINRHKTDMPSSLIIVRNCFYIQNLLIVMQKVTETRNIYTIIDLKTLTTVHMCYGMYPQYCDGMLIFTPVYNDIYSEIYTIINLANKTVTRSATTPYVMEKINQVIINKCDVNKVNTLNALNLTFIGKGHYCTATGTLLGTGIIDMRGDKFYGNYFVKINKMEIAPGAPVVEYEYKGKYLYIISNITGTLTKAALPDLC